MAMIRTLGLVSMISGLLIVLAYQATEARIASNRQRAVEEAVFKVIPGAVTRATFVADGDGFRRVEGEAAQGALYAGYDAAGALLGVAIQGSAQGYGDTIRALYGYDPRRQCIVGLTVLENKETPGLGDKVAKDPGFLKNFEALSVAVNGEQNALLHEIGLAKRGTAAEPWQIDGISGATVSSKAIARALNESAQQMIPAIQRHVDQFAVK